MKLRSFVWWAVAAALGAAPALALGAETVDASVTYRCPNNEYKNTISAKEADKLGCHRLTGAPITVIQTTKPRAAVATASGAASGARIDPVAQRARDSDARRILESELKGEQDKLAQMQKDFNNGQPERQGDEKNFQKYIDRVADMRAAIARKEGDITALRREIQKLPPSAVPQ